MHHRFVKLETNTSTTHENNDDDDDEDEKIFQSQVYLPINY